MYSGYAPGFLPNAFIRLTGFPYLLIFPLMKFLLDFNIVGFFIINAISRKFQIISLIARIILFYLICLIIKSTRDSAATKGPSCCSKPGIPSCVRITPILMPALFLHMYTFEVVFRDLFHCSLFNCQHRAEGVRGNRWL